MPIKSHWVRAMLPPSERFTFLSCRLSVRDRSVERTCSNRFRILFSSACEYVCGFFMRAQRSIIIHVFRSSDYYPNPPILPYLATLKDDREHGKLIYPPTGKSRSFICLTAFFVLKNKFTRSIEDLSGQSGRRFSNS